MFPPSPLFSVKNRPFYATRESRFGSLWGRHTHANADKDWIKEKNFFFFFDFERKTLKEKEHFSGIPPLPPKNFRVFYFLLGPRLLVFHWANLGGKKGKKICLKIPWTSPFFLRLQGPPGETIFKIFFFLSFSNSPTHTHARVYLFSPIPLLLVFVLLGFFCLPCSLVIFFFFRFLSPWWNSE